MCSPFQHNFFTPCRYSRPFLFAPLPVVDLGTVQVRFRQRRRAGAAGALPPKGLQHLAAVGATRRAAAARAAALRRRAARVLVPRRAARGSGAAARLRFAVSAPTVLAGQPSCAAARRRKSRRGRGGSTEPPARGQRTQRWLGCAARRQPLRASVAVQPLQPVIALIAPPTRVAGAMPADGETFLFTSESVNEGHPDKLCDQVRKAARRRQPWARRALLTRLAPRPAGVGRRAGRVPGAGPVLQGACGRVRAARYAD